MPIAHSLNDRYPRPNPMLIIGHRGARQEAPENTLAGFRYLRTLGIHRVELDLHLSQDGQLVVIHDDTVDRTTQHQGHVHDYTAQQLGAMDATQGRTSDSTHPGIPLLDDVLSQWPTLKHIQLEVKPPSRQQVSTLAQALTDAIATHHITQQAVVTSSDAFFLEHMQQRYPAIVRGYVAERFTKNPVKLCQRLGCQYLILHKARCHKRLVQHAHVCQLHVSVWTVNSHRTAKKVIRDGADSLITDTPSHLLTLLPKAPHG